MSQCQKILEILSDGREHEMRDIHRHVGFCRLNSRVAELRSRGHEISCRRQGHHYFYKLGAAVLPSLPSASTGTPSSNPTLSPPRGTQSVRSQRDGDGVLTIFEVVA